MLRRLLLGTTVWLCAFTAFAEEEGFSVGLGAVSVNGAGAPFPVVDVNRQQLMLIPDISYHWQEWSLSTQGLGWQPSFTDNSESRFLLGFPRSSISHTVSRGWLKYGASAGLSYSNGLVAELEANAAGVSYQRQQGLGDRREQWQQQWSFTAPLFIPRQREGILLGSVGLQWQNSAYTQQSFDLTTSLSEPRYSQTYAQAMLIWPWTAQLTTLTSMRYSWADADLQALNETFERSPLSFFLLISWSLGRGN